MKQKLYIMFANMLQAKVNCEEDSALSTEWCDRWNDRIVKACEIALPHGSGFDSGTSFDFDNSKRDKLVFNTSFHHMSEHGDYTKWTEHSVVVTPSLLHGFEVRVTGRDYRDYRDIKDYMGEEFHECLNQEYDMADFD